VLQDLAQKPHALDDLIFPVSDLKESLWTASKRCGLGRVAPHHLRHARLSELASSTHDTAAVQYLAGHASLTTTDRYVRSSTTRAAAVLRAVEEPKVR
jgi:site-specific recombinase XerD